MNNRHAADAVLSIPQNPVQSVPDQENPTGEKYPNRFKPGQSGNPGGRPKKTKEEEALLQELKKLTPLAIAKMKKMLENDHVAALAKVRIIEIILERTFGKVENPVKVTSAEESVEEVQAELEALFDSLDDRPEGGVVQ